MPLTPAKLGGEVAMSNSQPSSPRSEFNATPAVIEAGGVYTETELAKRMRWKKHSLRQAKKLGLRSIRFGSRNYVLGSDVLKWFEGLQQQKEAES
jgi:hypothetical protein